MQPTYCVCVYTGKASRSHLCALTVNPRHTVRLVPAHPVEQRVHSLRSPGVCCAAVSQPSQVACVSLLRQLSSEADKHHPTLAYYTIIGMVEDVKRPKRLDQWLLRRATRFLKKSLVVAGAVSVTGVIITQAVTSVSSRSKSA